VGLFPQTFIDDVKRAADIVLVVQDYVPLKAAGTSYKGLCPFHAEKTPSFTVNREKGFFFCFGCGAGGDVFKFLELHEKLGFQDAVKLLAARFGLPLPETPASPDERGDSAERESLLKAHEVALEYFREQLAGGGGTPARRMLEDRALAAGTIAQLGIGYAPPARQGLKKRLTERGFALPLLLRSGLVLQRENGDVVDRFRGRLMFPICRESGSVVAFGGRAMEAGQQPKYLNSPETAIYTKGRTLYGLHVTKAAIRRLGYSVLVEGYFDFAQALQAGVETVVASCGTALTVQQAQLLKRFSAKVVLSFDPDPAGQGAAARSSTLLVAEGFQVNVATLPPGQDPDSFVRKEGAAAYVNAIRTSRPYLDYLLERSAQAHDLGTDGGRRAFLNEMLLLASQIPDAAARDRFADRLSHKARVTEDVVRAEIRRAAVERRTVLTARELPGFGEVRQAEKGLVWGLVHDTAAALDAVGSLEPADLEDLVTRGVLEVARTLRDLPQAAVPAALLSRLNEVEAQLVAAIAAEPSPPAPAADCGRALKRLRCERERAAVQREIDRLQDAGGGDRDRLIEGLWRRKKDLLQQIEALT
jgi:DNA primase